MLGPKPYLVLPGTAKPALEFYRDVFGGDLQLHTFEAFGRTDGPADAIAHGVLTGTVELYAADAGDGEATLTTSGLFFSLLGTASPQVLRSWYEVLTVGGTVLDALQERAWGDWDGQVVDQFGLTWLIGFEGSALD